MGFEPTKISLQDLKTCAFDRFATLPLVTRWETLDRQFLSPTASNRLASLATLTHLARHLADRGWGEKYTGIIII